MRGDGRKFDHGHAMGEQVAAVGDQQDGAAIERGEKVAQQGGGGGVVEVFGGLVDDHYSGAGQHHTGEGQALALAAGERATVLADHGVQAVRQTGQPVAQLNGGQCGVQVVIGGVGAGAIGMMAALLPAAGLILALSFTVALLAAPALSVRFAGRSSARIAPARGEAQQRLLTVLDGAAELTVYGAVDTALDELRTLDDDLRRAEARTAWGAGLGTAVAVLAAGGGLLLTMWVGAQAIASGELTGVALAVVVLLPLSVHELVALLTPAAAVSYTHLTLPTSDLV